MTVVRKHPARRHHAPNRGRTFPNKPRKANQRRIVNGSRPIHSHDNANILDLVKSLETDKARAIYGWLRTKCSKLSSHIGKIEHRLGNSLNLKDEERRSLEKDLSTDYNNLKTFQKSKARMEEILSTDLNVSIYTLQKKVFPVHVNVYDARGVTDGKSLITCAVESLAKADDRYKNVII